MYTKPTAVGLRFRSRSSTWSCRCCSARSMPAACVPPKPGCCALTTSTSSQASCVPPRVGKGGKDRQVRVVARCATSSRLSRPRRRAHSRDSFSSGPGKPRSPTSTRTSAGSCGRPAFPTSEPGHDRVHDLRHSFAVDNCRSWFARRERRRVAAGPAGLHGPLLDRRHELLPEADRRVLPAHHCPAQARLR